MKVIERAKSMDFTAIEKAKATASRLVVGAAALAVSSMSFAAGPDLTSLTTAIDFGTVVTAVLAVAAALVVVYIAWKGAKMVLSAVRGG